MDTKIVAEQFEISRRRVQQLAKEYREGGEIPELETPNHVHEILKEYDLDEPLATEVTTDD